MNFHVTHHPGIPEKHWANESAPAAMSAATGMSAEECAAAINHMQVDPYWYQVKGVRDDVIAFALNACMVAAIQADVARWEKPRTLRAYLEIRGAYYTPIIIMVRSHWLAVQEHMLVDNHNPTGIPWREYNRLGSRVRHVMAVLPDRFAVPRGLPCWTPDNHLEGKRGVPRGRRDRCES